MAYATPKDLIDRYDANDLGDLATDDGSQVSEAALAKNSKILAALDDASGEVDAALLVGNRYSPVELRDLTGHSRSHLVRIVCDIAAARMMGRRLGRDIEKVKLVIELAEGHLERLRRGENVFNLQPQKDAGNPSAIGLSVVEYSQSDLIRDRTRRYYPARR